MAVTDSVASYVEAIQSLAAENDNPKGDLISKLFTRAESLKDVRAAVNEVRNGVRESLRNLDKAGMLSADQREALSELFPPRGSGSAEVEDTE